MDKTSKIKIEMSKKSTKLSATRTLFSAIRTSIVCLSLGFALLKIDKKSGLDIYTIIIFAIAALIMIAGFIGYFIYLKIIDKQAETATKVGIDDIK